MRRYIGFFLISLGAAVLVSCGGSQTEPETPETSEAESSASTDEEHAPAAAEDPCEAAIEAANEPYAAKRYDEVGPLLDEAWEICGDGHDILEMKAIVAAVQDDLDSAVDLIRQELESPPASERAYELVATIWPRLDEAQRARLLTLGSTPDTALEPPSMRAEYTWASGVVCGGEEPPTYGQGTMQHDGQTIELLTFDCPDGSSHDVYFVPPPDPMEKMFEERLGE